MKDQCAAYDAAKRAAEAAKQLCYKGCEVTRCLPNGDVQVILEDGCKIACDTAAGLAKKAAWATYTAAVGACHGEWGLSCKLSCLIFY